MGRTNWIETPDGQWALSIKAYRNTLAIYQEIGIEMKSYRREKGKWKKRNVRSLWVKADFVGPSVFIDAGAWTKETRSKPFLGGEPADNDNEIEIAIRKGGATIYGQSTEGMGKMIIKGVIGSGGANIEGYGVLETGSVEAGDYNSDQ